MASSGIERYFLVALRQGRLQQQPCNLLFLRSLSSSHHIGIPIKIKQYKRYNVADNIWDDGSSRILTRRAVPINRQFTRNLKIPKRMTIEEIETKLKDKSRIEWQKVVLFGDSITRRSNDPDNGCWGSYIDHKVGAYFDVDVRGFEGYNSKWGLELMPKLFPKSYLTKVDIFVIFFGHNDSWAQGVPMHVPVAEYEVNMRNIIKYLQEDGLDKNKIVLITPTWYHREEFKKWLLKSGYPTIFKELEEARKYSETVLGIGKSESIDVVDFFDVSLNHKPLEEMFCDGVHFSRIGAKMLFDKLMPVIEKKIEAQYKKPLVDLWHSVPFDQRPEIKSMIEAHIKSSKGDN